MKWSYVEVLSFAVNPLNSVCSESTGSEDIGGGTNTLLLFDRHWSGHNMSDHVFLHVVFFSKQEIEFVMQHMNTNAMNQVTNFFN